MICQKFVRDMDALEFELAGGVYEDMLIELAQRSGV